MSRVKRARASVGELNERRWSVVSERGREAAGLTYADAAALVRRLLGEKVYGTCVVTDEAAARIGGTGAPRGDDAASSGSNGAQPAKRQRAARKRKADAEAGG